MRARTVLLLLVILTGIACSGGSDKASHKQDTVPVPKLSPPGNLRFDRTAWIDFWQHFPSPTEPTCVDVRQRPSAKSGQFVVGNFASFIEHWDGSPEESKLAYTPLYPDTLPPLTVVADKIGSSADPISFQFPQVAWTPDGMPFYVSGTVIPERGRWRLEASVGRNRGCFEFTL
jgi:hypothetical protein